MLLFPSPCKTGPAEVTPANAPPSARLCDELGTVRQFLLAQSAGWWGGGGGGGEDLIQHLKIKNPSPPFFYILFCFCFFVFLMQYSYVTCLVADAGICAIPVAMLAFGYVFHRGRVSTTKPVTRHQLQRLH